MKHSHQFPDGVPKGVNGSLARFSQQRLESGEGHFNRIEVGAVGREKEEAGARGLDHFAHAAALVTGQVVHDHDVAGRECRDQEPLDIGLEPVAVDRPVHHHRRDHAASAQTRDQCRGFSVAMRIAHAQALAPAAPAMAARHVGRRPRLIDEHQFLGGQIELPVEPVPAPLQDVGAVLLGRVPGLFFTEMPWRWKNRDRDEAEDATPSPAR